MLAAGLGLTACTATSPNVTAESILPYSRALERALQAHPETPDAVGDAAVDLIVAIDAAR